MMKFIMSMGLGILMLEFFNMGIIFIMNFMFILSVFFLFMYLGGGYSWSVSYSFCLMDYSFFLILLSVWISSLMFMSLISEGHIMEMKLKVKMIMIVLLVLFFFFCSMNLLIFYFFFEVSLIPTFFMVYYWGNNMERIEASFYLIIYMLFISLPLLVYLVYMYSLNFCLNMESSMLIFKLWVVNNIGVWDFMIIFGAFFIKLPIYLFHIWLPKAHVEAPVWGSMLLAAILLKMGGYGVIRLLYIFIYLCYKYGVLIFSVSIVGALYSSVLCLVQVDLKNLVAYSSVVHMNLMLSGIMTLLKLSLLSAMMIMISHGLCSSGLFYMVNMYYWRVGSRLMVLNKGGINKFSGVMIWWFLLCSSNFSFPFSLNFFGEISLVMVLLNWWKNSLFFLMMICFFSGGYSLYLYSMISHGKNVEFQKGVKFDLIIEHLNSFLHYMPLFMMILNLSVF